MNNVIILAGNSFDTENNVPVCFLMVNKKPLIIYLLEIYQSHPAIDEIGVICPEGCQRKLKIMVRKYGITKFKWVLESSVYYSDELIGIREAQRRYYFKDIIIFHDTAFPNIAHEYISECITECLERGTAVCISNCNRETAFIGSKEINSEGIYYTIYPQAYTLEKLLLAVSSQDFNIVVKKRSICGVLLDCGENINYISLPSTSSIFVDSRKKLEVFIALNDIDNILKRKDKDVNSRKISLTKQRLEENDGTMVTIICTTYNHERYIAQAIDSFLMQKTNFKFKIFIGEDCGPDRTKDIVMDYARRYPDIIVPFLRKKNLGATRNFVEMVEHATSPYIATCEGDDYWIDEFKLQKQYDYMEAHKDYSFCFARTEVKTDNKGDLFNYYTPNKDGKYIFPDCEPGYIFKKPPLTAFDFISKFPEHTSTYFFRWNYDVTFPEWFYGGIVGDIPLRLIQMRDGKAGYIMDVVSVYRRNETGAFSKFHDKDELFMNTRGEYIRWLSGMLSYYREEGIKKYPKGLIEKRIKSEMYNFFNTALNKLNDYESAVRMLEKYPDATKFILKYYCAADSDRRILESGLGWEGYQAVVRNKYFRNALKPFAKHCAKVLKHRKEKMRRKSK